MYKITDYYNLIKCQNSETCDKIEKIILDNGFAAGTEGPVTLTTSKEEKEGILKLLRKHKELEFSLIEN